MAAQQILPVPTQKEHDPETISDFEKGEGDPNMVMALPVPPPNRVKLLYKGHQILNAIFGIIIGSIAVLRWYTGRAELVKTPILIYIVHSIVLVLVCVLPQSKVSRYCLSQEGRCVALEAYIWTGAMVLDDYVALLMINTDYIRIVMIPGMLIVLIGTLGWKLRKIGIVEDSNSESTTDKHNNKEEILCLEEKNSSDKLELLEFVSYLFQLSLVTWSQYKGQQGSTPVLSDFLLFLCSALGALGVMLASPLAGVDYLAVSVQVLPVLHKTCTVLLLIAVHTLAAEWLGNDMIYVCLPELITAFVWFAVCFGESLTVSSFTSHESQLIIGGSVVAILACLVPWIANDGNTRVSLIIWWFWISISSSASSQFHVWLLQGWPRGASESSKLVHLLNVGTTVSISITVAILSAYMMVTGPRILYKQAIYSLVHKAMAAVVAIIFLLAFLVWSVRCRPGHPETRIQGILLILLSWYEHSCLRSRPAHLQNQIQKIPVTLKLSDMLENKLLPKLDKLLNDQQDTLPSAVRENVAFLQLRLTEMHRIIVCFESDSSSDVQGKTWMSLVQHLDRNINDWAEHVDESETWEFSKRIVEAMEQGICLYFERSYSNRRSIVHRSPGNPVGLDGPRDNLLNIVGSKSKELKVVSIVGMPGSGKTVVASMVYDSDRIFWKFKCRCWVQLGRVDTAIMAVNCIMLELMGENSLSDAIYASLDVKITSISLFLQETRYFVILDGLEDTETWRSIKACFPENNLGSRIIITTQIQDVAIASATAPDYVYKTNLLDRVQAETLFYQKAFPSDPAGVCPDDMKVVSAHILGKCHGLPLAIVSLGHVLASKPSTADEFYRPGLPWQELKDMRMVIKHCYDKLHPELRMCLLYLSIFPVEISIDVDRLVRRWIAEELIEGHHPSTYEEKVVIADDYICELVRRNLIMCHDGINRTISIHPVIHNFIICMSMEENFVTLIHSQQDVLPRNDTAPRLSLVNNGKQDKAAALRYGGNLRSVTVFGNTVGMPLLSETSRLHVLDLEGCNGPLFIDGLYNLFFLRYLSLKGTDVSELPANIGQLTSLETLDVRSTKVKEIPLSILRLEKLMHLLAGNAKLPCGIRKMKMLFALSCPDVTTNSTSIMQELSEIDNLSELELFCDSTKVSRDKKLVAFPSNGFDRLHKLCVHCGQSSLILETGALQQVKVLGLIWDKGLPKEPTPMFGIEYLLSLKHVHFEYSGDDANAKVMVAVVKKAVNTEVTVTEKVGTPSTPNYEELYRYLEQEADEIFEEEKYRNPEEKSEEILEELKQDEYYERLEGTADRSAPDYGDRIIKAATWLMDSCIVNHATGEFALLSGVTSVNDNLFITAANGVRLRIYARGSVTTDTMLLRDVWYIPGLTQNIVSSVQLVRLGYNITFTHDTFFVSSATDGTVIGNGHGLEDGLIKIDFLKVPAVI